MGLALLKKDKSNSKNNNELNSQVHATIKNVTEDILSYRLNKAIARIRELFNYVSDEVSKESGDLTNSYFGIKTVIQLLNPFIATKGASKLFKTNRNWKSETRSRHQILLMQNLIED